MFNSGIRRGAAVVAVSTLAVAVSSLLVGTASGSPLTSVTPVNQVELYAPLTSTISPLGDGTNTTVSLLAGAGVNVTRVEFQSSINGGADYTLDPRRVGHHAQRRRRVRVRLAASSIPDGLTNVRVMAPNGETDASPAARTSGPSVELASEGMIGTFDAPYGLSDGGFPRGRTGAPVVGDPRGLWLGVTGTASDTTQAVTVTDASHNSTATATATAANLGLVDADGAGAGTTGVFNVALNIDPAGESGYERTGAPDQIVLNARNSSSDDSEASTLVPQNITSITATPETQSMPNPNDSDVLLSVVGLLGPVANAQVGIVDDKGTPSAADDVNLVLGYTDGNGHFRDQARTTYGTFRYYANTTNNNAYQVGLDPTDTASVTDGTVTPPNPGPCGVGQVPINPGIRAVNVDRSRVGMDWVKVGAGCAVGAKVKLFQVLPRGGRVMVRSATISDKGQKIWILPDPNRVGLRTFYAVVNATDKNQRGVTPRVSIR